MTKVLDFGVVHIFGHDAQQGRITKTGGFVGTLNYAAPEQMQGKPAGPANDVYAAALVLFELIAGKGPFDDDPGVGLSRCFKPAPRLTELVPDAPRDVTEIIAKALEQDPSRRPTAGALARELRRSLNAVPEEADAVRAEVVEFGLLNRSIHQVDECCAVEDLDRLQRVYAGTLRALFAG